MYNHLLVEQSCVGTRKARAGHYLTNNIPVRRIFGFCVISFPLFWACLNILAGGKDNLLCILVTFLSLFSPFYLPYAGKISILQLCPWSTMIMISLGLEGLEFLEFHQAFNIGVVGGPLHQSHRLNPIGWQKITSTLALQGVHCSQGTSMIWSTGLPLSQWFQWRVGSLHPYLKIVIFLHKLATSVR